MLPSLSVRTPAWLVVPILTLAPWKTPVPATVKLPVAARSSLSLLPDCNCKREPVPV